MARWVCLRRHCFIILTHFRYEFFPRQAFDQLAQNRLFEGIEADRA